MTNFVGRLIFTIFFGSIFWAHNRLSCSDRPEHSICVKKVSVFSLASSFVSNPSGFSINNKKYNKIIF